MDVEVIGWLIGISAGSPSFRSIASATCAALERSAPIKR
jgi:hypothetical protein